MNDLLLPVVLPIGVAALCLALGLWHVRRPGVALVLGALANAAGFLAAARHEGRLELALGGFGMKLSLELAHDVGLVLLGSTALLFLALSPFAAIALRAARRPWTLVSAALLGVAALNAVLLAADPFTLLVAWEALLPIVFLALVAEGAEAAAVRALAALGGADLCLVAAVGLLEHLAPAEPSHLPVAGAAGLAFALGTVAVLGRLAAFPFHGWAADAAEGAASPVAALLVSLVARTAGVLLAVRLAASFFLVEGWAAAALLALGALTLAAGALRAAVAADARRAAAHLGAAASGAVLLAAGGNAPAGVLVAGALATLVGGVLALVAGSQPVPSPHAALAARVRAAPVLGPLARCAEADPAVLARALVTVVATLLFAVERSVNVVFDVVLVGLARGAARLAVKGDGGDHARYVIWSLVGLALVVLVFVGGF